MKYNNLNNKVSRVVVLGGKGFVGSEIILKLKQNNIPVISISRKEIDLVDNSSTEYLAEKLNKNDILVIASAIAPVKNNTMLTKNIIMVENICNALSLQKVKKILYVSSDAVYADKINPLNEDSLTNPVSLHGMMHLTREMMLKELNTITLAIVRPTLIYGKNDPHNGYGPNSFNRLTKEYKSIKLFGRGEEKRDHVFIEDVAELSCSIILGEFQGILNIATGNTFSFKEVAEKIKHMYEKDLEIEYLERKGSMPHDGLRSFDSKKTTKFFPEFKYTSLDEGLNYFKNKNKTKT